MASSRLLALTITKFKSIYEKTRVEFGALTIFLGKNNSGKSTITQVMLLLKQTLELSRVETALHLDGYVSAINLRELTSGWPDNDVGGTEGPSFSIEWSSWVDVPQALEVSGLPDMSTLMERADLPWLAKFKDESVELFTRMDLSYSDMNGKVVLDFVELYTSLEAAALKEKSLSALLRISKDVEGRYECSWSGTTRKKMEVGLHHFIPSLSIDKRNVGPRNTLRSLANAFNILFAQPLDDLEALLKGFSYLSSTRGLPPPFYSPSSSGGDDLGISGEFAAPLLYAHKDDLVHYMLPDFEDVNAELKFRERSLSEAVNEVMNGLGIETPLSIHEIEKVGFRLMFGNATLSHVGRGLTYLLPIIQLGLFSDPRRFESIGEDPSSYHRAATKLCAFEEPESHLHPKVQSRLANWFVSLARSNRQVIVETHSDHLVRRLRTMVAQSTSGGELEKWLITNIRVVSVSQKNGKTLIEPTPFKRDGGMEVWPSDFMDAAATGEQEIYYAALDKEEVNANASSENILHQDEDEPKC